MLCRTDQLLLHRLPKPALANEADRAFSNRAIIFSKIEVLEICKMTFFEILNSVIFAISTDRRSLQSIFLFEVPILSLDD
jgi:hypothetical protein